MLPMFEKKKAASVILEKRGKPDVEVASEVAGPGSEMHPGLLEAAQDMLRAFEGKSAHDLAQAWQAAFQICESYPHKEAEHEE